MLVVFTYNSSDFISLFYFFAVECYIQKHAICSLLTILFCFYYHCFLLIVVVNSLKCIHISFFKGLFIWTFSNSRSPLWNSKAVTCITGLFYSMYRVCAKISYACFFEHSGIKFLNNLTIQRFLFFNMDKLYGNDCYWEW